MESWCIRGSGNNVPVPYPARILTLVILPFILWEKILTYGSYCSKSGVQTFACLGRYIGENASRESGEPHQNSKSPIPADSHVMLMPCAVETFPLLSKPLMPALLTSVSLCGSGRLRCPHPRDNPFRKLPH